MPGAAPATSATPSPCGPCMQQVRGAERPWGAPGGRQEACPVEQNQTWPWTALCRATSHPPAYGLSLGPMIVACQWNRSSPTGPAEQFAGGSFLRSSSSFMMRFDAMLACCVVGGVGIGRAHYGGGWEGRAFMYRVVLGAASCAPRPPGSRFERPAPWPALMDSTVRALAGQAKKLCSVLMAPGARAKRRPPASAACHPGIASSSSSTVTTAALVHACRSPRGQGWGYAVRAIALGAVPRLAQW